MIVDRFKKEPCGIGVAIGAIAVLWSVPLYRAVVFASYTRGVLRADDSLNAWSDVVYANQILAAYGLSLLAGCAGMYLLGKGKWPFVLPVLSSLFGALWLIRVQPEQVITLFPTAEPFLVLGATAASAAAALLAAALRRALLRLRRQRET